MVTYVGPNKQAIPGVADPAASRGLAVSRLLSDYPKNPILDRTDGAWDTTSVANPIVLKLPVALQGSLGRQAYVMLYLGWTGAGTPRYLGLAEASSPFGPWTKYSGNPVIGAAGVPAGYVDFEQGSVIVDYSTTPPTFVLYISVRTVAVPWVGAVARYTSPDLITWTYDQVVLNVGGAGSYDEIRATEMSVINTGAQLDGIYTARDAAGTLTLAQADSADGVNWIKDAAYNPVIKNHPAHWNATKEIHQLIQYGGYPLVLYEAVAGAYFRGFKLGLAFGNRLFNAWGHPPTPWIEPEEDWEASGTIADGRSYPPNIVHPYLLLDNGDALLFYVMAKEDDLLVAAGGAGLPHKIHVARVDPSVFRATYWRQLEWELWEAKAVLAAGETTQIVPVSGWGKKTFYVYSNQIFDVTVEVDIAGSGNFRTLAEELARPANTLWRLQTAYDFRDARMTITPAVDATVTAQIVTGRDE